MAGNNTGGASAAESHVGDMSELSPEEKETMEKVGAMDLSPCLYGVVL